MKAFSNIGDPYGMPDGGVGAFVPPRRIIPLIPQIFGGGQNAVNNYHIPTDVGGAMLIVPGFNGSNGTKITLPPLNAVPNGWSVTLYIAAYSNFGNFVYTDNTSDYIGLDSQINVNQWQTSGETIATFMAVDLTGPMQTGGSAGTSTWMFAESKTAKRWLLIPQLTMATQISRNAAAGATTLNVVNYGSAIVGGTRQSATGDRGFIGGGDNNSVGGSATNSVVVGGSSNQVTGSYSGAVAGLSTSVSGTYSSSLGGQSTFTGGTQSTTLNGYYAHNKSINGYLVYTNGAGLLYGNANGSKSFSNMGLLPLGKQTSSATAAILTSDGNGTATASNQLAIAANELIHVKGTVVAFVSSGNSKVWEFNAVIQRGAASNAALIGTPTINVIAGDAGASAWSIAVTADTTNQALAVTVTGQASTTIRWNCRLETTEVGY